MWDTKKWSESEVVALCQMWMASCDYFLSGYLDALERRVEYIVPAEDRLGFCEPPRFTKFVDGKKHGKTQLRDIHWLRSFRPQAK